MKPRYSKPPLSVQAQAQLLLNRGLCGISEEELVVYLSRVSLYRLRGYTYPFQAQNNSNHPFVAGATWQKIHACYSLDQQLRLLILGAIETIEVAVRTQLVLQCSNAHGAQWYENPDLFFKRNNWENDLKSLDEDWSRSKEPFVTHYQDAYEPTFRPPAWMIFETCSLGSLSKVFENVRINLEAKKTIAPYFGMPASGLLVLSSWIHHLSTVRNICAHHGRLYSRIFIQTPKYLENPVDDWVRPWPNAQRLYASLSIMIYLLRRIHGEHPFRDQLLDLINNTDPVYLLSMGFPTTWRQEMFWK